MQIPFALMGKGKFQGKYAIKKVDTIRIEWVKQPKKFEVYTWRPGFSWILRQAFTDYEMKITEINFNAEEISSLMIKMDEGYEVEEYDGKVFYAMNNIYVGYTAYSLKLAPCAGLKDKVTTFDFDKQRSTEIPFIKDWRNNRAKISITYEKLTTNHRKLLNSLPYVNKAKARADDVIEKLTQIQKTASEGTVTQLQEFKAHTLKGVTNTDYDRLKNQGATQTKPIRFDKFGTKEYPAQDCLALKKMNQKIFSGFYYIKTDCSKKAIRVYCDFTIPGHEALDIFIFNDELNETNPDLSYLKIKDFTNVQYHCARYGLEPIEINHKDTISRIHNILMIKGYNLSLSVVVPLGYDYTCKSGTKCDFKMFKPLSRNYSKLPTINSFFANNGDLKNNPVEKGPFAGFGLSAKPDMISFKADKKITALVCSSNHFKNNKQDNLLKIIQDCAFAPAGNPQFRSGSNILVSCPTNCHSIDNELYGTNIYHASSPICKAAIHAKLISADGGKVNVRIMRKPQDSYEGSTSNNITSSDFSIKDGTIGFALLEYKTVCPLKQLKLDLGIKDELSFIEQEVTEANVSAEDLENGMPMDPNMGSNEIKPNEISQEQFADNMVTNTGTDYTGISEQQAAEYMNTPTQEDLLNAAPYNGDNQNEIALGDDEMSRFVQKSEFGPPLPGGLPGATMPTGMPAGMPKPAMPTGMPTGIPDPSKLTSAAKGALSSLPTNLAGVVNMAKQNAANTLSNAQSAVTNAVGGALSGAQQEVTKMANQLTNKMNELENKAEDLVNNNVEENTGGFIDDSAIEVSQSTEDGILAIKRIRKDIDWDYLDSIKEKVGNIKTTIEDFNRQLAWSKDGSQYSNMDIKSNLGL
jgi:hypothetical protein